MHKYSIQMSCFHWPDLNSFLAPAHYLIGMNVGHRRGHFSPLEHHILSYPAVGVYIHPLILIANKHFHSICLRQDDNGMRSDIALNLEDKERPGIILFQNKTVS